MDNLAIKLYLYYACYADGIQGISLLLQLKSAVKEIASEKGKLVYKEAYSILTKKPDDDDDDDDHDEVKERQPPQAGTSSSDDDIRIALLKKWVGNASQMLMKVSVSIVYINFNTHILYFFFFKFETIRSCYKIIHHILSVHTLKYVLISISYCDFLLHCFVFKLTKSDGNFIFS